MTTVNPRRLGDALRACARGIHPLEAGTGLLIDCGSWLHREDFTSRFITTGTSISDGVTIDHRNASLVIKAIARATGHTHLQAGSR